MSSFPAVSLLFVLDQHRYKWRKNKQTASFAIQQSGIVLKNKPTHVSHWHSFKLVEKVFIWGVGGKADVGGGWSDKRRSVFGERNTAKNEQVLTDNTNR